MNLYLISQDANDGYDTYDSAVVAAESEDEAKTIHPGYFPDRSLPAPQDADHYGYSSWVRNIEDVKAKLIGVAVVGTERGVILASFNAS